MSRHIRMKHFSDGHTEEIITDSPPPGASAGREEPAAKPLSAEERAAWTIRKAPPTYGEAALLLLRYESTVSALEAELATSRSALAAEREQANELVAIIDSWVKRGEELDRALAAERAAGEAAAARIRELEKAARDALTRPSADTLEALRSVLAARALAADPEHPTATEPTLPSTIEELTHALTVALNVIDELDAYFLKPREPYATEYWEEQRRRYLVMRVEDIHNLIARIRTSEPLPNASRAVDREHHTPTEENKQ